VIVNGKLNSPTGTRKIVSFVSAAQFTPVEVIEWSTQEREAQEIELLVYPLFYGEAGVTPAFIGSPWQTVFMELQLALGGRSDEPISSAGQFSTFIADSNNALVSNLSLPSNGLRTRFCARGARLRVVQCTSANFNCALFAFLSPCVGTDVRPIPSVIDLAAAVAVGSAVVVPKGAREIRCQSSDPLGNLTMWYPGAPPTIGSRMPMGGAADWVPFDPNAYLVGYEASGGFADDGLIFAEFR
jgi:hypothetical protein